MRNPFKSGLFAAVGVTFGLALSSADALAGVTSVASTSVVSPPTSIEEAHYSPARIVITCATRITVGRCAGIMRCATTAMAMIPRPLGRQPRRRQGSSRQNYLFALLRLSL